MPASVKLRVSRAAGYIRAKCLSLTGDKVILMCKKRALKFISCIWLVNIFNGFSDFWQTERRHTRATWRCPNDAKSSSCSEIEVTFVDRLKGNDSTCVLLRGVERIHPHQYVRRIYWDEGIFYQPVHFSIADRCRINIFIRSATGIFFFGHDLLKGTPDIKTSSLLHLRWAIVLCMQLANKIKPK